MRIKSKLFMLIFFLLLFSNTVSVIAHPCDPPCQGCQTCEAGVCVDDDDECDDCQYCYMGTCMWYGDCGGGCPACESCVSCWCQCTSDCCSDSDCGGECHNCNNNCWCENDDDKCFGCESCEFGSCEDDNYKCSWSVNCEICTNGTCENRCLALGKHCWYGDCVECRDVLDCVLCEECVHNKCEHPCDDECYYPKYCGSACACVECEYVEEEEDTTTCSTANSTTECNCSHNIINPCSSGESVVYSGNSLKSCTGANCGSANVLCYTTYQTCWANGSIQPLEWCSGVGLGGVIVCEVMLGVPGPGCYTCVNSLESGVPTYESQGDCPIELWPE